MDGDERYRWRHGAHRWRRGVDPNPGRHKRPPWPPNPGRRWVAVRTPLGVSAASVMTIVAVGSYLLPLLRPAGQLQPGRLPGIEQQIPTVEESAIERLQASDEPPASRSQPRQTPAPVLSREPDRPRPPDGASPTPEAAATPPPDGGTAAQGPMPTTPGPPPLPPKPKKSKKAAAAEVSAGPDGITKKLFILKPERTGPAG